MTEHSAPPSPPLPPLPPGISPVSEPAPVVALPPSPPSSATKPKPHAIIVSTHNTNLAPSLPSPRRGSIAAHLMSFASRSTTSLNILSSSAPSSSTSPQDFETRSTIQPHRSSPFSNPFKKLQSSFHTHTNSFGSGSSKKSFDIGIKSSEKILSSSSSANSLTSWRSRGADIFSKKTWSRSRKNSEPLLGNNSMVPLFGAKLDDAIRMSHIQGTPMVPAILYRSAEFLEAKGVQEVGLYRISGAHANVQKLKKDFDTGKDLDLMKLDPDPNDIATLLKLFLRELPTPLLPPTFLEEFQQLLSQAPSSTDRRICHSLRGILVRLPRANYDVLSFLCHHLSRIAAHSEKTKMNVSNLGVVFAPTLSIGSVLFKALLGGYYDTAETLENRERGLEIVWGGYSQDLNYSGLQDWPEETPAALADPDRVHPLQSMASPTHSLHHPPLTPAQEIVVNTALANARASMALSRSSISAESGPEPVARTKLPEPPLSPMDETAADDEAKLMAAMLQQEDEATKRDDDDAASTASHSSSVPCTDNTAISAVSSPGTVAKENAFEASFTSPSMPFASPSSSPSMAPFSPQVDSIQTESKPESVPLSHSQEPSLPALSTASSSATLSAAAISSTCQVITPPSSVPSTTVDSSLSESDPLKIAPSIAPTINIMIDDSSLFPMESTEQPSSKEENTPQLPPLEGLMIST
ncbi:hypothetical protein BGW38_005558 [Lunasporangiospora selenospora]|uniref:Rho-GAP domain-containing protein n=1 Tax=Lunasporangiospora selenospora TaxID=979761 RepID=A0A9P6KBD9_9FUNG|nr:hypothetical protein BGW38_005558 [Lunasporangiospora selenospora]